MLIVGKMSLLWIQISNAKSIPFQQYPCEACGNLIQNLSSVSTQIHFHHPRQTRVPFPERSSHSSASHSFIKSYIIVMSAHSVKKLRLLDHWKHYNLDVNAQSVDGKSQKHKEVIVFMVPEPVESEAKDHMNAPLVISPEHIQVEKLELTEEGGVHASPVSVLEPNFLNDATSPKNQKPDSGKLFSYKLRNIRQLA